MNTVENTVDNNLCISCGICKAVCPKNCINYEKRNGLNLPIVDKSSCVDCGRCYQVCPGKGFDYTKFLPREMDSSFWSGSCRAVYVAGARDQKRRKNAVSGGVVTELLHNLLKDGEYSSAFVIGTHEYLKEEVCTKRYTGEQSLEDTQKSRYLPVSQEEAVSYMLSHREEKVVLVGTSCFVQGILNVIDAYRLNRNHYFIIGLFCDKTMTLNVVSYFNNHAALKGRSMKKLFFRTKEAGGWPGNVQMESDEGEVIQLPNTERMKVKEYFQPERCLYCLDKLNMFADISVGDNYTKEHSDSEGSNSVIIRTDEGERIWNKYAEAFIFHSSSIENVKASQHLKKRQDNYCFARLKEKSVKQKINVTGTLTAEPEITWRIRIKYWLRRLKLRIGANYNKAPWVLSICLIWKNLKIKIKNIIRG